MFSVIMTLMTLNMTIYHLMTKYIFSVIHMGLVLASFEKTRNSVKVRFLDFYPSGILDLAFLCVLFGRIVYIILQELIGNIYPLLFV